jgi:hypothetical protein
MMAMTKAEMEMHRDTYQVFMGKASSAQEAGLYREAVDFAISSWDHIDGMMQYERKYSGKEFSSIEAIDFVLRYALLLLDFESLDKLETLLHSQKRILKNTTVDLGDTLVKARIVMWEAHRFWHYLDQHVAVREDSFRADHGSDPKRWRSIAEEWAEMGLVRRLPEAGTHRLSLITHMDQPILAKCPSCAAVVKAAKAKFLDEQSCPKCLQKRTFVFLEKEPASRE